MGKNDGLMYPLLSKLRELCARMCRATQEHPLYGSKVSIHDRLRAIGYELETAGNTCQWYVMDIGSELRLSLTDEGGIDAPTKLSDKVSIYLNDIKGTSFKRYRSDVTLGEYLASEGA